MEKKISFTKVLSLILIIIIIASVAIPLVAFVSAKNEIDNIDIPSKIHDAVADYYKVSNRAEIRIDYAQKESKLDVLKVTDLIYIQKDRKDNDANADVLYEAMGSGIFSVDLNMAEIITDEERNSILVRIQEPKLECTADRFIDLYYKDGIFTSKKAANEFSFELQNESIKKIRKSISDNENYYKLAKDNAVKDIEGLFKKLNSDNKDLIVEVEFINW